MTQPELVDLVILGGGCAGLSLARELANQSAPGNTEKSIVVLEPRESYEDDKSWCFWASETDPPAAWASYRWSQWLFGLQGKQQESRHCTGIQYHYVRSIDFYNHSLVLLQQQPNIQISLGNAAQAVTACEAGWLVIGTQKNYLARQVLDTRPPPKETVNQSTLFQTFLGVEIELPSGIGLPADHMELMCNMRLVNGAFCFDYILPYTANHVLVEVTFFSNPQPSMKTMQAELDQLLASRGWTQYRILRTEHGMLPMGLPENSIDKNAVALKLPVQAGLRAGALRPSSGYGYLRIQRWASACAKHYIATGQLLPQIRSGFLLRQMDRLFLNVLRHEPGLTPVLFNNMLSKTAPHRFIRFMDDRAGLLDCLHVVASMPKLPFLKALLSWALFSRARRT